MRLLLLSPMLLLSAASAAAPAEEPVAADTSAAITATGAMPVIDPGGSSVAECPPVSRYHAQQRGSFPGARKLNELPAADMYKTVYRRIDGCEVPIIAQYGLGRPTR